MDASKKQREPVAFKSLAELKRFIRPGVEFKTVSHANHADMVGLTRVVTTVQTVGFYSKIKDQPEHPFSTCNHGKGFYTDFGKAGNYIFDGTTVKVKDARKQDRGVIYELEFYNRKQNDGQKNGEFYQGAVSPRHPHPAQFDGRPLRAHSPRHGG